MVNSRNDDSGRIQPPNAHLRNLSYGEQIKIARGGNQQDRMALERIYGKAVWEALLQNPGITVGEVARDEHVLGIGTSAFGIAGDVAAVVQFVGELDEMRHDPVGQV